MNEPKTKHIKTFWAIVAVLVVALVGGGAIYFSAYNNELQDDLNSIYFTSPIGFHKLPAKEIKVSTSTPVQINLKKK